MFTYSFRCVDQCLLFLHEDSNNGLGFFHSGGSPIFCMADLSAMKSGCLLGNVLISPSFFEGWFCWIFNSSLTYFLLSPLWICYTTAFWHPWFLMIKQLIIILRPFCIFVKDTFSLVAFKMCPQMNLFEFILLGGLWAFGVCRLMFSSNLKRKSQPLSLQVGFFVLFSVSSSGISIIYMSMHLRVCQWFLMLSLFFHSFFSLLFRLDNLDWCTFKLADNLSCPLK